MFCIYKIEALNSCKLVLLPRNDCLFKLYYQFISFDDSGNSEMM